MTTKFLDNKIFTFKILLSWRSPRKIAFWTISLPAPLPTPPWKVQILFLLSSRFSDSQSFFFQTWGPRAPDTWPWTGVTLSARLTIPGLLDKRFWEFSLGLRLAKGEGSKQVGLTIPDFHGLTLLSALWDKKGPTERHRGHVQVNREESPRDRAMGNLFSYAPSDRWCFGWGGYWLSCRMYVCVSLWIFGSAETVSPSEMTNLLTGFLKHSRQ